MSDPFDLGDIPEEETARGPSISQRAAASAPAPYLQSLNGPQREAVEALDGPVLVLAGAGTGKTRVLTTRLAHVLNTKRAWPGQILAVTFTNKAAREMKQRIGALIGGVVEGMQWLGTFHALGAKILRRHAELAGLRSDFTILDSDDQVRLMKQVIQAADHIVDIGTAQQGQRDIVERPVQIIGRLERLAAHPQNTEAFIIRQQLTGTDGVDIFRR